MKTSIGIILIPFLLVPSCLSLYEDQVGKFDWKREFIGCPYQTWFGRIDGHETLLVVSTENVYARIDVRNGEIVWRRLNERHIVAGQSQIDAIDGSTLVLKLGQKYRAFDFYNGAFQWQKKLKFKDDTEAEQQQSQHGGVEETDCLRVTIDPRTGNAQIHLDQEEMVNVQIPVDDVPIREVKIIAAASAGTELYKIFVHRADCRLDLYKISNSGDNKPKLLWSRHESLANISDVLMVDLPLSEAQAQIESEFNQNEPIWRSFLLRIHSQMEQLHRFFVKTATRFVQTMSLIIRGQLDYSLLIRELLQEDNNKLRLDGDAAEGEGGAPLERDYFNMHKMIVVSTLAGVLHGLNSINGQVLWSLHLGETFAPYREGKVPLFLLRGTSFYQWGSQAAAVYNANNSTDSMVLVFNPMTGKRIDQLEVPGGLLRVELWPSPSTEQLYPLLIVRNKRPKAVELWPHVQMESHAVKPVFLMMVHKDTGFLEGYEVAIEYGEGGGQLRPRWRSSLFGFQDADNAGNFQHSIVAIHGKSVNEKVHSQGHVLGNRSVLYKYVNPNLVAILLSNSTEQSLWLQLVDVVSGEIVYGGKIARALPPFHLIHCENWIVVGYWNEKARRTEITVIELFEGLPQNNSTAFDSLQPRREGPQAVSQSYIFPQGISAMAATNTQQGLTSRSVLIAIPFGGILEMSRRLLDARRPLEMTPELREEMLVPYIPELPLATEDLINYNQTVKNVRGIRTAPSGLESTSLVFVYGLDLFYTRVMPSGTFDILKDDFDYIFISAVVVLSTIASYILKRISRYQSVQKAWE